MNVRERLALSRMAREEYEAGDSVETIAGRYDLDQCEVRKRLIEAGATMRGPREPTELNPGLAEEIRADYTHRKLTMNAIAKRRGLSSALVRRTLSAEIADEAVAMGLDHGTGMGVMEIAEKHGRNPGTVAQRLMAIGVKLGDANGAATLPLPDAEALKAEYEAGATASELGRKYGVSHTTMLSRLRGAGTKMRPGVSGNVAGSLGGKSARREATNAKLPDLATLRAEYEAGASTVTLGKKYGVGATTISVKVREAGGEMRVPGGNAKKLRLASSGDLMHDEAKRLLMAADYNAGMTMREVGLKHGVSDGHVGKLLKGLVKVRRNHSRQSKSSHLPSGAELLAEFEAGNTVGKLAAKYAVDHGAIHSRVKKAREARAEKAGKVVQMAGTAVQMALEPETAPAAPPPKPKPAPAEAPEPVEAKEPEQMVALSKLAPSDDGMVWLMAIFGHATLSALKLKGKKAKAAAKLRRRIGKAIVAFEDYEAA